MARRRKRSLSGPARAYRRSPKRYEDVRHTPMKGGTTFATRLGCRDAVKGRKNPYKPEARGFVAAYREGYRICERILDGRRLSSEEYRVAAKLDLETEASITRRILKKYK